ncbi:hypothetical protein BH18ACT6_BH18ACT6_23280 [soil metagenome]
MMTDVSMSPCDLGSGTGGWRLIQEPIHVLAKRFCLHLGSLFKDRCDEFSGYEFSGFDR